MALKWTDSQAIGEYLADHHSDISPLSVSFVKLHKLVTTIPEFDDDPERSNEKILEAIQMVWLDEAD